MRGLVLCLLVLTCASFSADAKVLKVQALLKSGEHQELYTKGYKKGLFSPYSKFKNEAKERVEISDIVSFTITETKEEFEVFKVSIAEDEGYVIATQILPELYKTIAAYRPCTCNDNFRNVTAYVHVVEGTKRVILKRVLSDKIIKLEGEYSGLTPELEKELKPLKYSFSAIPSLLSVGRN
ncbi:MAG: hypothetical protein AB8B53_04620 [Flavobacteriales bacterium]